jgi:putative flippase GtrA
MSRAPGTPLHQRKGLRQLVKFCIVGASSTIVDKGVLWLLLNKYFWLPWWYCASASFVLAVTNGFIWNRHWTFRAHDHAKIHEQYPKFVLTNIIGLLLNLSFTKIFLILFTGQIVHKVANPEPKLVIYASLCAIPFVVVWNFSASKYWTFRAPTVLQETPQETPLETPPAGDVNTSLS